MRKFLAILLILSTYVTVYGQKTAQEYFNVSARLYAEKQQEAALYTVSRGCELFESDSSLAQLKRLIEGENNQKNKQNKNQQGNNNNDQNQSEQGQSQNGQNNDQQNQQGNQESQQKGEQQQQNQQQQQGQQSDEERQGQRGDNNSQGDQKGQISKIQAEMMLDAIDQDDKAVQQRLNMQKQNKKNNNRIEKNW